MNQSTTRIALSLKRHNVSLHGITTAYWSSDASGVPVILLHGLSGSHHGLLPFAAKMTDYKLFLPDLPGHGDTEVPETQDITKIMDWFVDFVTYVHKQTGKKPIIIAHSLGAQIAFEACQRMDDQYQTCILLNPVPHVGMLPRLLQRSLALTPQRLAYGLGANQYAQMWRNFYLQIRYDKESSDRVRWVIRHSINRPKNFAYYVGISSSLAEHCCFTAEAAAKGRFACVIADHDRMLTAKSTQLLYDLFGKDTIAVCEGTGHLMPIEMPAETAKLVHDLINKQVTSASVRPAV